MRRGWIAVTLVGLLSFGFSAYFAGEHHALSPTSLAAADDCQAFSQTGFQVCGDFLNYWKANGGLAQQGYPISPTFQEKSETDGKTYTVQYFERAVFEAHPENQPPYNVLLSLLGSQKYKTRYPNGAPASGSVAATATSIVAPTTAPASKYPIRVTNGPLALTIWAVTDPAPTDAYLKPSAGNRVVAFDVTIESVGAAIHYNAYEAKLQTTDDRVYDQSGNTTLKPTMQYGDLASGEKVRAWLTFEIPQGSTMAVFRYNDFGKNPVSVKLP